VHTQSQFSHSVDKIEHNTCNLTALKYTVGTLSKAWSYESVQHLHIKHNSCKTTMFIDHFHLKTINHQCIGEAKFSYKENEKIDLCAFFEKLSSLDPLYPRYTHATKTMQRQYIPESYWASLKTVKAYKLGDWDIDNRAEERDWKRITCSHWIAYIRSVTIPVTWYFARFLWREIEAAGDQVREKDKKIHAVGFRQLLEVRLVAKIIV